MLNGWNIARAASFMDEICIAKAETLYGGCNIAETATLYG
jgi:hypothetical protein